jgi:hypothetical protein
MIYWSNENGRPENEELGALTSELQVQVLNGSVTGCLVESTRALAVGTVAALRMSVLGREYEDFVQVVRCHWIPGAGSTYHVGMQFLPTTPPSEESLRQAIHRELGRSTAWLHAPGEKT